MCVVGGCEDDNIVARGLCSRHYRWARRHNFAESVPNLGARKVKPNEDGRTVPEWEPGLVTHSPAGTIILHGGSGVGYRSYGCRCRACKEANRARVERDRRRRVGSEIPNTVAHGKASTYSNWGCKCDPCAEAWKIKCDTYYSKVLSAEARYQAQLEAYEAGKKKGPKPVAPRLRRAN